MKQTRGNRSGLQHENVDNSVYAQYVCIKCRSFNYVSLGTKMLSPQEAFDTAKWVCNNPNCSFVHSKNSNLPFEKWPEADRNSLSPVALNFWKYFFKDATESRERFWQYCRSCGRLLPVTHFNVHDRVPKKKGGPLNTQFECRACKNSIVNTKLNKKRTSEQLREASTNSNLGDLFARPGHKKFSNETDIFQRFGSKCFCCNEPLKINNRKSWAIDHIAPSSFFFPLTKENAALLCKNCNGKKSNIWPSDFYTPQQLENLALITGGNLSLWSGPAKYNDDIYPNEAISRTLVNIRKNTSNATLEKRRKKLSVVIREKGLGYLLSDNSRVLLGLFDKEDKKNER